MPEFLINQKTVCYGTGGVPWKKETTGAEEQSNAVVFIHGAGNNKSVWPLQARTLARRGRKVAALDLPGHGQSEDDPSLESIASHAEWLAACLDGLLPSDAQRPPGRADLVGHSMGSCIALELAARHPERVGRLVVIGAGTRMPVNDALLEDTRSNALRAHQFITAFGHGRRAHFGGAETPGMWNLGAAMALLAGCAPEVLHRDFAACNAWSGEGLAERIRCPSLVIAGAQDRMTPASVGRSLADNLVDARFELIEGAGHMMMAEAPTEVTQHIEHFLTRV